MLRLFVFFSFIFLSFYTQAQVDTTWLHFRYLPDGTRVTPQTGGGIEVDIRINKSPTNYFYLEENKTFSVRKTNGVPTDSYFPMAGFNSIQYTQGHLRNIFPGRNDYVQNYRLLFPNNYNANYEQGYPLIVFTHGFGERGNCWGNSCYFPTTAWDANTNFYNERQFTSVTNNGGPVLNFASPHGFQNNQRVVVSGSSVPAYNGIRTITTGGTLTNTQLRIQGISFSATATGTIRRLIASTHTILSVANDGTNAVFTTNGPHQFTANTTVIIENSLPNYNGSRTLVPITETTFRLNGVPFAGNSTGDITTDNLRRLLNNDHSMTHGGRVHQDAVNLAGSKLPDDPTLNSRAFPGFVLFTQNLNGWGSGADAAHTIRTIRLLMKKYKIDPNRVFVHGLSDGGAGAYFLTRNAPWLFAAALPMSAVGNANIVSNNMFSHLRSIPYWTFQGGVDGNPTPTTTQNFVRQFRDAGMDVRFTLYPNLGHGTWNAAYAEPDFFTYMLSKNKANPVVLFGNKQICATSGVGVTMALANGFFAYEWERDGQIIVAGGPEHHTFTASLPGTYRARFSRKQNPGPNDWNRWSDPIEITESLPVKPTFKADNSIIFPTIHGNSITGNNALKLSTTKDADRYLWYRNNLTQPVNFGFGVFNDTVTVVTVPDGDNVYILEKATFGGCKSPVSDTLRTPKSTPANLSAPSAFAGVAQSNSSIYLTWTDNSPNDKGFEVWRRKSGTTIYRYVARTEEDAVSYLDTKLEAGTTYEYKLRAVSVNARSVYVPGDLTLTTFLAVTTQGDTTPPTPPQNLLVTVNSVNSITLAWDAATDNNGIKQYLVTYGATTVPTASTQTTFTITGLPINTAYPITVKAEDFALNQSPPSNQIFGSTFVDGLFYTHSTGAWKSLDPVISASTNLPQPSPADFPPIQWLTSEFAGKMPTPLPTGNPFNVTPAIDDPRGIATQQDFYNIKFDGYLNIPTNVSPQTQIYQFRTTSEDGSMLFLDGFNPLDVTQFRYVNNDFQHSPTTVGSADVPLSPGPHRIVVLFFAFTGSQSLTVQFRIKTGASSYTGWTNVPPSMLSTGVYTPPTPPVAPTTLAATATGLTSINLTWAYGGAPADEFEVYRSLSDLGTYSIVGRGTGIAFTDGTALPGITYFYKLKTVNSNGTSAFSNTASATTTVDSQAPTVPLNLVLNSKTFSNIAFSWTAATDNIAVAGYQVLVDGVVVDSTEVASYMVTGLAPGTAYSLTVRAFDVSGNISAASGALGVTTNNGAVFFSKANGALNSTGTWGTNGDGTGTAPNFSFNGQTFMVSNRVATGLGGSLTIGGSVSKIIVPDGTTLDVDNPISAKVEVQGTGVVNLNSATAPDFLSLSPTSTVNFNSINTVQARTYGNVNLNGTGNYNFQPGETSIMGDLFAEADVSLKGVPTNGTTVRLYGDLILNGAPGIVAPDNAIDLHLLKAGVQNVFVGGTTSDALDFFRITTGSTTTVNVNNSNDAITVNVGSNQGGGLVLTNGSSLNLGSNHLTLKNAGTINSDGQTGRLLINESNLTLSSGSSQNSNLHVDATINSANLVTTNFSGGGRLNVQTPVRIVEGLKIRAGEVNAGAGNVTLVSNAFSTAYLQEIEGNGSVTGQVNVQRWVIAARKFRYMSSPVANLPVSAWQPYMPITGPFTGSSPNSPNASMFYWNATAPTPGYQRYPVSANTETFQRGQGYSIFNYNGNSPLTLTTTGTPYQGSWSFVLGGGTGANNGWNLIGNPYASAIQWNNVATNWTRTNVSPIVHVPDNTGPTLVFRTWDAATNLGTLSSGIIAPGQAFWVQATTAAPVLTITERAKRTTASSFYREDAPVNSFTIFLNSSTTQDPAYVILGSQYTDAFEPEADGRKFNNEVLNLSTRATDNTELVFNKVADSFCEKQIGVTVENVVPGNYSLSFANVSNLMGVGEITLTDNFTQTTQVVNDSEAYAFAVTANTASFGKSRFTLSLGRPTLQKTAGVSAANLCGGTAATIELTNTQPGAFYYASLPGTANPLSSEIISAGGNVTLEIPVASLAAGNNSFEIHTGFKGCSNELLLQSAVNLTYTVPPVVSVEESSFSICQGTPVMLTATTEPGNTFNWYENGNLISGQHGSTLSTDLLKKSAIYEVAAVSQSGCEGLRAMMTVTVENVPAPFLDFDGDNITLIENPAAGIFVQWYKDNEPLEEFGNFVTPKEEGQYSVLLSSNGCSRISDPFNYVVTGVEADENLGEFAAYVYPNPASHDNLYLKLETPSDADAEFNLIDLSGKKVFSKVISGSKANGVHKMNFPQDTMPGLYIVVIQQGDIMVQRKLIVVFR